MNYLKILLLGVILTIPRTQSTQQQSPSAYEFTSNFRKRLGMPGILDEYINSSFRISDKEIHVSQKGISKLFPISKVTNHSETYFSYKTADEIVFYIEIKNSTISKIEHYRGAGQLDIYYNRN